MKENYTLTGSVKIQKIISSKYTHKITFNKKNLNKLFTYTTNIEDSEKHATASQETPSKLISAFSNTSPTTRLVALLELDNNCPKCHKRNKNAYCKHMISLTHGYQNTNGDLTFHASSEKISTLGESDVLKRLKTIPVGSFARARLDISVNTSPIKQEPEFNKKFGWNRAQGTKNYRSALKYTLKENTQLKNIKHFDLRDNNCPPVYDQGQLGSCTANAAAFAFQYEEILKKQPNVFLPSRLFIYYNERKVEGHVDSDNGATIQDSVQVLYDYGACDEKIWPYDISNFTTKPSQRAYDQALQHKVTKFKNIDQNLDQIKISIINYNPVVFGFNVYDSFRTIDEKGIMPMPKQDEKILGGHAVVAVGFDDTMKCFTVRNSWGESWGDKGYFYMPYEFITNPEYASEFYAITDISDEEDDEEDDEDDYEDEDADVDVDEDNDDDDMMVVSDGVKNQK